MSAATTAEARAVRRRIGELLAKHGRTCEELAERLGLTVASTARRLEGRCAFRVGELVAFVLWMREVEPAVTLDVLLGLEGEGRSNSSASSPGDRAGRQKKTRAGLENRSRVPKWHPSTEETSCRP
jgi:hypothetical protein